MTSPPERPSHLATRPWLTLVAAAFCAEGLFLALYISPVSHGVDFYHVNFVPAAVRSGFNVYDRADHPAILDQIDHSIVGETSERLPLCVGINRRLYATGFCPTATPLLYAIHAIGLVGPFDVRFWIFHLAATALGIVGLYLTARSSGLDRQISWLTCGLATSFCWGLFLDAQLANVTRIQLFGLAIALLGAVSRHRWGMFLAGAALAFGAAYKPTILPSIAFGLTVLIVDRRWKEVAKGFLGLACGSVSALLIPLILFPSLDCWWDWRRYAGAELIELAQTFSSNYSPRAALADFGAGGAAIFTWGVLAAILLALVATAAPSGSDPRAARWRDDRLCMAIALGPLWTILASPLTWVQYSALAMPLTIVMIGVAGRARSFRHRWIVGAAIAGALSGGIVQRFVPIDSLRADCVLLWLGWIGLLGLALGLIAFAAPTWPRQRSRWIDWRSRATARRRMSDVGVR